jgi:hypothetical protein
MPPWVHEFVDWILRHLSARYASVIAVVTGILLFGTRFLSPLGLDKILQTYRPWIGLTFLFSTVLTATYPISSAWTWGRGKFEKRSAKREMRMVFAKLGADQIAVLQRFAETHKNSERFSLYNGAVQDLVGKKILTYYTQPQTPNGIAFNLTPMAAELVHGGYLREVVLKGAKTLGETSA